ncbi:N-methyl-L-tryptophan oxidase [Nocardioides mangrovi]|uniref:N-methyl-L-tryptophan oxidase n=1 Tax=Nocardioides mangrovi TaxID=2874580 RepID=A0ABS7UDB0_9ACTN|nr:N-methyl-L-tryptophan oxidase [Nocardioides mangrovi]MBZ5738696.1 N-methyl-L-tryptophan oxidase [Nocardioides mangrovi]
MSESYDVVVVGLGALGSATAWQLARRGVRVLGLERFELGHRRGASHDTSRILRHSYHTPEYVRLTQDAYADWAELSAEHGQDLVTVVGGLDLFPPDPAIPLIDYTDSLTEVGIDFELLDVAAIGSRWPQFVLPEGTVGLYQERAAIVPAGPGTAAMQQLARGHGADLRDHAEVVAVTGRGVTLADGTTYSCGSVVLCADAWTNHLLAPLGHELPLTVTLEQATYFAPPTPDDFTADRMPLWIWMDEPSFYGFPCYGEPTVKAAQDCGGPAVDPDARGTDADDAMLALLADHVARMLPGAGRPVRSLRCQYTLTPDRDFVMDRVSDHPSLVVGLGAGHGFKFAPTFGRLLADLATGERLSVSPTFALDRPALTDPAYTAHWLV